MFTHVYESDINVKPIQIKREVIEQILYVFVKDTQISKITVKSTVLNNFTMKVNYLSSQKQILTYVPNPKIKWL